MKFKEYVLVRNIENPDDYKIEEIELKFRDLMIRNSFNVLDFFLVIFGIWMLLLIIIGATIFLIWNIKTYF